MTTEEEVSRIYRAAEIMLNYPDRPANSKGVPGGLIDLRKDNTAVSVIGDLHGAFQNLEAITEKNRRKLEQGSVKMIILGDALHSDQPRKLDKFESSETMLMDITEILTEYPHKIIYLKGNHDTFSGSVTKGGVRQGALFRTYLAEKKGREFVQAVDYFFSVLPYCVIGDQFFVIHAGPPRGGISYEDLVDIEGHSTIADQVIWNRLSVFGETGHLYEYSEQDIRDTIKKLGLPPESSFIVGHNPRWSMENHSGIWEDVQGIRNHWIVISNQQTKAAFLSIEKGEVKPNFAL